MSSKSILQREEELKNAVYKKLDSIVDSEVNNVRRHRDEVEKGAFEEKLTPNITSLLRFAENKKDDVEIRIGEISKNPYFSHVEVFYDGEENARTQFFLSDNESLEEGISISEPGGEDGMLLPFKQDKKRPVSSAVIRCHMKKNGAPEPFQSCDIVLTIVPTLICDTVIRDRVLLDVTQLYPDMEPEETMISFDELLDQRLQENRNDPKLRNIISSLQIHQFEIIESDIHKSFVVQGCAGSGKSQCIVHRLFYMRGELSDAGWDKVLLVTPTKLFREYAAELMDRYQLSDVNNCSVSELYQTLLSAYDVRFKDRQYVFQLSEEYLPDEYLVKVYSEENIKKIETEIESAICNYVANGCKQIGRDVPEKIDNTVIQEMLNELDSLLMVYDERDRRLRAIDGYTEKKNEYWKLRNKIRTIEEEKEKQKGLLASHRGAKAGALGILHGFQMIEREKGEIIKQRQKMIQELILEMEACNLNEDKNDLENYKKYRRLFTEFIDLSEGEGYKSFQEKLEEIERKKDAGRDKLNRSVRNMTPGDLIYNLGKKTMDIRARMDSLEKDSLEMTLRLEALEGEIIELAGDGDDVDESIVRRKNERRQARYFLSRLESAVFEQEVWKALSQVKAEYNIETIQVEELEDGKHKNSRILYKSDLLFYLMIYKRLHSHASLPDYRFICIDEAQDLHPTEYNMLHELFPNVPFNVFGDLEQVLHTSCGIHDWEQETGISEVHTLSTNYRNVAAIVDFCNKKFGSDMKYIGKVRDDASPKVLKSYGQVKDVIDTNKPVIIVKNRDAYDELCDQTGLADGDYNYLDTNSEVKTEHGKECYSIYAAKGLEFTNVLVYAKNMTRNQKVVACTRAMGELYYYE